MMREMKRVLWEEEGDCDDDEESVLKERRALVEGESCSSWSWVGIGVGFVEVNADKGSEPMFVFAFGVVFNVVAGSSQVVVMDHGKREKGEWLR